MKNRNLYILLSVAFLLLLGVFILFSNAQRQVLHYKETVKNSYDILKEYQNLSSNLKTAQINTKDFKGRSIEGIRPGLLDLLERINQNLINLNQLNTDLVNDERLLNIGQRINNQFQNFNAFASLPDSVVVSVSGIHNAVYDVQRSIDTSVVRAQNILEQSSIQFDQQVGQLTLWIVIFGLIAFGIIGYTIMAILRQVQKTRAAEGFLQSILNTTQNGILACSAVKERRKIVDYRIDYVNPGFEEITGMRKESVIGRPLSQVYQALTKLPL